MDDSAVAELDDSIEPTRHFNVVRDDDERRAQGFLRRKQEVDRGLGGIAVELPCRFVGENQRRPVRESTRQSHPLALSTGELVRKLVGVLGETKSIEEVHNIVKGDSAERRLELDILTRCQKWQQVMSLENEADPPPPKLGPFRLAQRRNPRVADPHFSGARRFERSDEAEEGRLARTAWTDDGDAAARLDRQVDAVDRMHDLPGDAVVAEDFVEPEG